MRGQPLPFEGQKTCLARAVAPEVEDSGFALQEIAHDSCQEKIVGAQAAGCRLAMLMAPGAEAAPPLLLSLEATG